VIGLALAVHVDSVGRQDNGRIVQDVFEPFGVRARHWKQVKRIYFLDEPHRAGGFATGYSTGYDEFYLVGVFQGHFELTLCHIGIAAHALLGASCGCRDFNHERSRKASAMSSTPETSA
jgi:hypothetical protein